MKLTYPFIFAIALSIGCQTQPGKQDHLASVMKKHFPNTLVNKKFVTDELIGLTNDNSDYMLSDYKLIDTTMAAEWSGNTVKFIDSVHFVSSYQAWCGNDCFTSVFGRYYFVDSLKVTFYTDSITRSGDCEAPTLYTKSRPAFDLFMVKLPKGRLQLNHEADDQDACE